MKKPKIKILSPISHIGEAEDLIRAGADEFYCGLFLNGHRFSSPRSPDNSKTSFTFETLEQFLKMAKKRGKDVFLALNNPIYKPDEWKVVKKNLRRLKKLDLDGVIVANFDLLEEFKGLGLNLAASSYFEAKNEETVRVLEEFGATRVIFDRQITLSDLAIARKFPQMEFEVFIIGGACRSIINYCHSMAELNKKDPKFGHLCWDKVRVRNEKGRLQKKTAETIAARLTTKGHYSCCGICALPDFAKNNITSLKIIGRDYPTDIKLKNLKMVKKGVEMLGEDLSDEEYRRRAKKLYREIFGVPCQFCFYPHFKNNGKSR